MKNLIKAFTRLITAVSVSVIIYLARLGIAIAILAVAIILGIAGAKYLGVM